MSSWKLNVIAIAATMFWFGSGTANAYVAEYEARHNGSKMLITIDDGFVEITYRRPRSGMRKHGVRSGTVLFSGTIKGRRVEGDAYVFRSGCQPAEYWVTGRFDPDKGRFVLRGDAPKRERGGCDVIDYSGSSSNARLVFTYSGGGDVDHSANDDEDGDGYCGWWAIYSCHKSRSAATRDQRDVGYGKVVKTSDVPNFRNGYYCLADGPLSGGRSRANRLADRARSDFSSAYIKQGC